MSFATGIGRGRGLRDIAMTPRGAISALLLVAALASAPASAEMFSRGGGGPPDGGMGGGPGLVFPMLLRHIDLTPDQEAQLHKIMSSERAQLRDLFHQLEAANDALADKLLAGGDVKRADLEPAVQQVAQLRQQLMEHGLKSALAMRAVLTPAQLAKAATMKARMQQLRSQMRDVMEGDEPAPAAPGAPPK